MQYSIRRAYAPAVIRYFAAGAEGDAAGGKIFVYQSGVLVAEYSYGYFKARDVFRVGLCVTIIEWLVLFVIVPFYWPLIGIH